MRRTHPPRARFWASRRTELPTYAQGRRDGLRLALAVLAAEEEKWAVLLGESASWRTNASREVRHKALQVAQRRVQTVLNRLAPKNEEEGSSELAAELEKLGL